MIPMSTLTCKDIRNEFKNLLRRKEFVKDKTGVKTIEIIGPSFVADEETLFAPVNEDYVKREIAWYESMSLFVKDIPGKAPPLWENVSSDDGRINSNYGWCFWSSPGNIGEHTAWTHNCNQGFRVVETLNKHQDSRQAIAIYTRPQMHLDSKKHNMSDFMCTNTVQYLIRDDQLVVVVNMRSNDVVYGYRNDRAWQLHAANWVKDKLHIGGMLDGIKLIWQVGSLHVYERHFNFVDPSYDESTKS